MAMLASVTIPSIHHDTTRAVACVCCFGQMGEMVHLQCTFRIWKEASELWVLGCEEHKTQSCSSHVFKRRFHLRVRKGAGEEARVCVWVCVCISVPPLHK